jgi:biopolymer transport protein TolQ
METAAETSIFDMILSGGIVVQGVLLLLLLLSVWSWGITISKWLFLRKANRDTEEFIRIFRESRNLSRIDDSSRRLISSPLVTVFVAGYNEVVRILQEQRSGMQIPREEALPIVRAALDRAENEEATRLENGTVFLATTASAAPFIGLFGTVWGILNAFRGLSTAKSTTVQAVAPGISEALVATAVGLAAAIPAAVAFNYVTAQVKLYRRKMRTFCNEFEVIAERSLPDSTDTMSQRNQAKM